MRLRQEKRQLPMPIKIKYRQLFIFTFFLIVILLNVNFTVVRAEVLDTIQSPQNIADENGGHVKELQEVENVMDEQVSDVLFPLEENWEQHFSYIKEIDIPAQIIYDFYEEDLPEDVILPKSQDVHPKISSIKIEISRKPPYFGDTPLIAIVIDDMGVSQRRTADIITLEYPLTSSFLTYVNNLDKQIEAAQKSGHEIIAHLPMEPQASLNVSPDVLTTVMSLDAVRIGLNQMLDKFRNIKGVNNHMGSKFTENEDRMNIVMEELSKRNLFFLDSKTTAQSIGEKVAEKNNVRYVSRNVFLDNQDKFDYIMRQLHQVEKVARRNGYAIAIGHPKAQTYKALKVWLPTLKSRNIKLVPLSRIVDILHTKNKI